MFFSDMQKMKPKNSTAKVEMLGQYDPEKELIIEDPYYVSNTVYTRKQSIPVVKDLYCDEKYKTLTASSFETGLYSVKL